MSRAKVRAALENAVNAFATANSLQVLWENKGAIPAVNYIRTQLFPGVTQDPSIGAKHKRYVGILRMTLAIKDLDNGPLKVEQLSGLLCDAFPRGKVFTKDDITVSIDSTPNESSINIDSTFVCISVDAIYRCDVITN